MESLVASIPTPFGEVELIPQDRNLLQASSVEPLRLGDLKIDLWAMLERKHESWGISRLVAPLVKVTGRSGHASSLAGESIRSRVMNSVTSLASEWAATHPEAFECAAAAAFELDKEGLHRELRALRDSLTSSAQAIEAIVAEAASENSARLRSYSRKMRSMALDVPAMQRLAQAIREDASSPTGALRRASNAPAADTEVYESGDATGARRNWNRPIFERPTVFRQSLSSNQLTLDQVLKHRRREMGLSQRELAFKLGIKVRQIARLESDSGARPSFQLLSRAANALGLDKARLFSMSETGVNSVSGRRIAIFHTKTNGRVWGTFARDVALLDQHHVRPQELRALSRVNLMGQVAGSKTLLFILDAIRKTSDTDK